MNQFRGFSKKDQTRKANKYSAKRVEMKGRTYDSKLEKAVAEQLEWMKKAGEIKSIQEQYPITFMINGHRIAKNIVDFKCEMATGEIWFIEAKGAETARYKILKELHKAMLDEICPGARYFIVRGSYSSPIWEELKLKRRSIDYLD